MAICEACERDMNSPDTFTCEPVILRFQGDLKRYAVQAYLGHYRCRECHVVYGGYHHVGCELMLCPRCQRPISSAGCLCVMEELFEPKPEILS